VQQIVISTGAYLSFQPKQEDNREVERPADPLFCDVSRGDGFIRSREFYSCLLELVPTAASVPVLRRPCVTAEYPKSRYETAGRMS